MIAKRRKRLMWLTGATLSAGSGLVVIVSVIIHALHAEYADGILADATGTAGGVSPDGVPSTTGMLIGAALIAVGVSVILVTQRSFSSSDEFRLRAIVRGWSQEVPGRASDCYDAR